MQRMNINEHDILSRHEEMRKLDYTPCVTEPVTTKEKRERKLVWEEGWKRKVMRREVVEFFHLIRSNLRGKLSPHLSVYYFMFYSTFFSKWNCGEKKLALFTHYQSPFCSVSLINKALWILLGGFTTLWQEATKLPWSDDSLTLPIMRTRSLGQNWMELDSLLETSWRIYFCQ